MKSDTAVFWAYLNARAGLLEEPSYRQYES